MIFAIPSNLQPFQDNFGVPTGLREAVSVSVTSKNYIVNQTLALTPVFVVAGTTYSITASRFADRPVSGDEALRCLCCSIHPSDLTYTKQKRNNAFLPFPFPMPVSTIAILPFPFPIPVSTRPRHVPV